MHLLLPACLIALALLPPAAVRADEPERPAPPTPNAERSAEEVVTLQLDALVMAADPQDERGMPTVWRFASPSNQTATGPFENFDHMVRAGYPALVGHADHELVAQQDIENAETPTKQFLIKVVDPAGVAHLFVWAVSRQADGEFEDCWMTDGVAPLQPPPPAEGNDRERVI